MYACVRTYVCVCGGGACVRACVRACVCVRVCVCALGGGGELSDITEQESI